jgi:archaellum component FlaG (FlaF/FlaG flagellin family)
MNNTPLNWSNETKFVPAKPKENTMTTYQYLENAEKELRNALKSSTDKAKSYQLRRIVDTINTIEDIKRFYKDEYTEYTFSLNDSGNINITSSPYDIYGSSSSPDTINFPAAQPVNIPGAFGQDVITFS